MNSVKTCLLVGLIIVSVVAIGVVGSAIPTLEKAVNKNTEEEYYGQGCIQEAVNAANSGDIIVVYNPEGGAYGGKVDITEQLTLEAEDLSDKPIILG
ncbi:hypothetical protein KGY72_07085, partial [Candidatus Bipolaricaulota bacterium]|nr:hypothetical protein [Candidatus Bipolaricaulota bacterium]